MRSKSFLFTFVALMVFSFGLAQAQSGSIDPVLVSGLYAGDSVAQDDLVRWDLHVTNQYGNKVSGSTNGFVVWTHSGGVLTSNYSPIGYDTIDAFDWKIKYDLVVGINPYSVNGTGKDTIGFGGAALAGPGIPDGTINEAAWYVETTPDTDGDTLCLDSVTVYPPGNPWIWSVVGMGTQTPAWAGAVCYHVYFVPDLCPDIVNCPPDTIHWDKCVLFVLDLNAVDPEGSPISWRVEDDGGLTGLSVDGNGVVTFQPNDSHVGNCYTVTIEAYDAAHGSGGCLAKACTFVVCFFNAGVGTFTDGCGDTVAVGMGNCASQDHDAVSADCQPIWFIICDVNPTPAPTSSYSIDPNTGLLTFCTTAPDDGGIVFDFTVGITDGIDTICDCHQYFDVLVTEPFEVQIEKTLLAIQGQHEYVCVSLNKGSEKMGGFDFLMAYDRSALNFQAIIPGLLFDPQYCDWEYITYRTWFWPSYEPHFFWGGIIRVVAIADMNNGADHPLCYTYDPKPFCLFTIDFIVTDNRLFECQFAPVSFFWTDCGDNTISSKTGDTLFVSRHVYGFDLVGEITDMYTGFPTYTGVQWECLIGGGPDKPYPLQFIDFISGGVDIACADELDDRGDINLNGVPNEIADAVVFTNYFIYGFSAFHINIWGQTAATDVNADGLTLTVGDLVYLVRVIVGDALPYPKLAPVEATYVNNQGVLTVDAEMGAAFATVRGNVTPTLLADGMEMKYAYNEEENLTRVLVYSLEGHGFQGQFLDVNGELVSIELGSYEGAVVKATEVPADFALNQNYPNPFNPTTMITFNLPTKSDYSLTIYNVTGQMVDEFAGEAEAGVVSIEFDASRLASGIYFYKLTAGDFSATKKMVFLK